MCIRTLAVVGATGNQGKAVITGLLQSDVSHNLKIRALTRDTTSDKSRGLQAQSMGSIETVEASLDDISTLDTALAGADYVFANLNSFLDINREVQQGKNVIDAAKRNRVKLFIWSTLPSFAAFTNGTYTNVRHAENKFRVQQYLAQSGLTWVGASTAFFASNFLLPGFVSAGEDGSYTILSNILKPDVVLPMTWLEKDLAPFVTATIEAYMNGNSYAPYNEVVVVAGFRASINDLAVELYKQTGKIANIKISTKDTSLELDEMLRSFNDFGFYEGECIPSEFVQKSYIHHSTLSKFVVEALLPILRSRGQ